jgi:hypothetical protein
VIAVKIILALVGWFLDLLAPFSSAADEACGWITDKLDDLQLR